MSAELTHYIRDLSVILGTAAVTGLVSQALRQPPVLGYLLAGMLIGPYVPGIVLGGEDSLDMTRNLSEFGVILLMFSVGLEFSLRKMARIGPAAGLTAVFEIGLLLTLGFLVGQAMGLGAVESLFVAGCICSSSTMIAAKTFEDQKLKGGFIDLTFAILVFDDMTTILVFAVLTAIASGAGLSAGEFGLALAQLVGFLVAMLAIGMFVVPRALRFVVARKSEELSLVAAVAVCFSLAALAAAAGYSVALGAFIAGILVSESGEGQKLTPLVVPLRNLFAAIFFIAVGMQIDPLQIVYELPTVLLLTAVVLFGKVVGVSTGAFLSGNGLKHSVRAGMSCAQNGEFSFIIATLGIGAGILGDYIFPVAVGVSVLTQLTTPWMVRNSERAALALERRLPARLQTFVTFYEAWIEQLRTSPRSTSLWAQLRGDIVVLALDAVLLCAVLAGSQIAHWEVVTALSQRFSLPAVAVDIAWLAATTIVALIFAIGVIRRIVALASRLAETVVPRRQTGKLDLGDAPRKVFVVALELALGLVVGLPLVALIQPFLPLSAAPIAFTFVIVGLVVNVWRGMGHLHGHVRAGTELVVEILARQSRESEDAARPSLEAVQEILPGFPDMRPVRLDPDHHGVGRTLAELNLRMRTGATVLAISREGSHSTTPAPHDPLRAGDILTLTGSDAALESALALLHHGAIEAAPPAPAPEHVEAGAAAP